MTTPFSKLSRANQRVAIAKDVLKQIKLKVFVAKTGHYVRIKEYWNPGIDHSCQLQEAINNKTVTCQVCGIGAIFSSMIKFKNHITLDQAQYAGIGTNEVKIQDKLKKYFTFSQLSLIEVAFEKKLTGLSTYKDMTNRKATPEEKSAIAFGRANGKPSDRLVAIMKNIIKNNGTFKV